MAKPSLHPIPPSAPPKDEESIDPSQQVESAIAALLERLPEADRHTLIRRLAKQVPPRPTPRGGETLDAVVNAVERLHGQQGEFKAQDVRTAVSDQGLSAKPKEVYNALSYLARRGHLQQVGYGRYVVRGLGIGIESTEDAGLEPRWGDDD